MLTPKQLIIAEIMNQKNPVWRQKAIVNATGLTQSLISYHFRKLTEIGAIGKGAKQGQYTILDREVLTQEMVAGELQELPRPDMKFLHATDIAVFDAAVALINMEIKEYKELQKTLQENLQELLSKTKAVVEWYRQQLRLRHTLQREIPRYDDVGFIAKQYTEDEWERFITDYRHRNGLAIERLENKDE